MPLRLAAGADSKARQTHFNRGFYLGHVSAGTIEQLWP